MHKKGGTSYYSARKELLSCAWMEGCRARGDVLERWDCLNQNPLIVALSCTIDSYSMSTLTPPPGRVNFAGSATPGTGNKYAKRNFSFEIKQVSLTQQKASPAPPAAVFCTINVNGGTKAFSSSIFEPKDKGSTGVYSFSSDEAVLGGLVLDTATNSVVAQLKVYPTTNNGDVIGEGTINITLGSSKTREGSVTLYQQKRSVGKLTYQIVKAEEAFFEDSASEDGDQAPPTPSPMPTTSRTMPPSSVSR